MSNNTKSEEKSLTVSDVLGKVSEAQFWAIRDVRPHYNRAAAKVFEALYPGVKTFAAFIEALAGEERFNISGLQRTIGKESEKRKNPTGKKEKKPRAAKKATTKGKKSSKSKLI